MKRLSTSLALLVLTIGTSATAQTFIWSRVNAPLPSSVEIYAGTAPGPVRAWYASVWANDTLIIPRALASTDADGKELVSTIASATQAHVAINAGYFDGGTNPAVSYSLVIADSTLRSRQVTSLTRNSQVYGVYRAAFGVRRDRSTETGWIGHNGTTLADIIRFNAPISNANGTPASATTAGTGAAWTGIVDAVGGGPSLVKNGVVNVTYDQEVFFGSGVGTSADPRTAIGRTSDGRIILFVVDGRSTQSVGLSLAELAQTMLSLGCVDAVNLDGGGSSAFVVNGAVMNAPSDGVERQVASAFAVLPAPRPPLFEKTIDTGGQEYREDAAGWSATGNPGSFGAAARLHPIGTGLSRAAFRLGVPKAATYDLHAWWVASTNRAKDAPFMVFSSGKVDTVRVDQTVRGGQWNLLGSYVFTGTDADSVVVTDAASPTAGQATTYVVADGLRLTSRDAAFAPTHVAPDAMPRTFELEQNFPNPFNPTTTFRFTLTSRTHVRLRILDLLGREVVRLVDEERSAGSYHVTWSPRVASGLYLCEMTAGGRMDVVRAVLAR
ncbi:MAG: phosphodiester glycosidase family protein [Bacteroidetes bacterium]|jgi:hypothetical protein|nr:phosphodiester glycosidase family protein [Bacteroidota bacterium]